MAEAKRRLKRIVCSHISLVDKGANQKTVIWKSGSAEPTHSKTVHIRKFNDEERMVYGVVYSPEEVDSQGDVAAADVIKGAAYEFMKARFTTNVDRQHDFDPDEGFVAESWITKKKDSLFPDDPEGSWAVGIKVTKDDTWEAIKKGEVSGLSMAGLAEAEVLEKRKEQPSGFFGRALHAMAGLFRKDFQDTITSYKLNEAVSALNSTMWRIMDNTELDEEKKRSEILDSVDQFRSYIVGGDLITKEGKTFSSKNLNKIKAAHAALAELIGLVEEAEPVQKQGDNSMDPQLITKAIQDALKPITDRLEKLEKAAPAAGQLTATGATGDGQNGQTIPETVTKAIQDAVKPIGERLEKVEKAVNGSTQTSGQESITKDKGFKGIRII